MSTMNLKTAAFNVDNMINELRPGGSGQSLLPLCHMLLIFFLYVGKYDLKVMKVVTLVT